MLIDHVDGVTRRRLVLARSTAMQKGCDAGLALLMDDLPVDVSGRAALLLLRCELLFLDHRFEQASQLYDDALLPLLSELEIRDAALIADNRSTIARIAFAVHEFQRFSHEADIRRLLDVDFRDWGAVWEASDNAKQGKHHASLPATWKLLLAGYRSQSWRAICASHADMARECGSLGWEDEALWHAVQSLNKDCVQQASRQLIAARDDKRLTRAIDRLLASSHLGQHAAYTCEALVLLYDTIPDAQVERVVAWLRARLDHSPQNRNEAHAQELVWKAIGRLAHRVLPATALSLATAINALPDLRDRVVWREAIVSAWTRLLPRLPTDMLDMFVPTAVALVTTAKADPDYPKSLNFVCKLAALSTSCRDKLRAALFPPGTKVGDTLLLQAAIHLGWQPTDIALLNDSTVDVARAINDQVQTLSSGQEPAKLGGFGTLSMTKDGTTTAIHIRGAISWLEAVLVYKDLLDDAAIDRLARAMLDMASNDTNVVHNRVELVECLASCIDRLSISTADCALNVLDKLAAGQFEESAIGQSHSEATHPLNPIKMGTGDPRDLRGVALAAIAEGSRRFGPWQQRLHEGLLMDFLESEDDNLRRLGVQAASNLPDLTEDEQAALTACVMEDIGPVRRPAMLVLAKQGLASANAQSLRLMVRAVTRAVESENFDDRACAATLAKSLRATPAIGARAETSLDRILSRLQIDTSHAVRSSAS